jgi:hypothetical protein
LRFTKDGKGLMPLPVHIKRCCGTRGTKLKTHYLSQEQSVQTNTGKPDIWWVIQVWEELSNLLSTRNSALTQCTARF